jgi:epoxyqueuosine reductase
MNGNTSRHSDKSSWIRQIIEDFIQSSGNTLENSADEKAFEKPLVGFASGDDQIFGEFKKEIGPFYLTPKEAFAKAYPDLGVKPGELTVISWILPHIKQTKLDNRKETTFPSERWARGKKFGDLVNMKLKKHLITVLGEAGFMTMAPAAPPHWSMRLSEKYGYASTWSERHAAYAAGLGTFGLCDGLITPVGKAMRCGSVVARITVPPTQRPYKTHTEYCLFLSEGACGRCMERCPVKAITEQGHDKEKCKAHIDGACTDYARTHYNLDVNGCGLCQTKVPCESGIPKSSHKDKQTRHR